MVIHRNSFLNIVLRMVSQKTLNNNNEYEYNDHSSYVTNGHVTIYIRVVMVFGYVLMDEMKITVVEEYVLRKLMCAYLLSIT